MCNSKAVDVLTCTTFIKNKAFFLLFLSNYYIFFMTK
jgi:hypothetical protein